MSNTDRLMIDNIDLFSGKVLDKIIIVTRKEVVRNMITTKIKFLFEDGSYITVLGDNYMLIQSWQKEQEA